MLDENVKIFKLPLITDMPFTDNRKKWQFIFITTLQKWYTKTSFKHENLSNLCNRRELLKANVGNIEEQIENEIKGDFLVKKRSKFFLCCARLEEHKIVRTC